MKFLRLELISGLLCACICANAQITDAALDGSVCDKKGNIVAGALVVATHGPSGTAYHCLTDIKGHYSISGMRSGGPYSIEFSSLGYRDLCIKDVELVLAGHTNVNAVMEESTQTLKEAVVISSGNSICGSASGSVCNISPSEMTLVPSTDANILDITRLSPYGGNGMSFGGSDGRSNSFTVDGASFNNILGLSSDLPAGGNPISVYALDRLQVAIAPYDVRQNGFIGGTLNAITKSGTNDFKATAYAYHDNEYMRGDYICKSPVSGARDTYRNTIAGFTLGGPIIRNKLFFFTSFETVQNKSVANYWRPSEDGVANPDAFISRTTVADMQTVSDHLRTKYGYDAGSWTNYPADNSTYKVLGRLDWNINGNHHLAVRYNWTGDKQWYTPSPNSSDATFRTEGRLSKYSMAFSNTMYGIDDCIHSISADLSSQLGSKLSNKVLATYSLTDNARTSPSGIFPFIDIMDGSKHSYMSAGYELFSYNCGTKCNVFSIKDDLKYFTGGHNITAGVSYEFQSARNSYMRNGTGYYRYNSMSDFLNGAAPESFCLTYGYNGNTQPFTQVRHHKAAIYAQDEWRISDKFSMTLGLRLDGIFFDNSDLVTNEAIKATDYGGVHIDTGKWPNPSIQINPRVGFRWDIAGDNVFVMRGGTGLFTGKLPLVYFLNMPANSGMFQNLVKVTQKTDQQDLLNSLAGGLITSTDKMIELLHAYDPVKYPLEISPETGVKPATVQAIDPNFKMPQVWKSSLAMDFNIPVSFPFTISVEGIFNKAVYAAMLQDVNLKDINSLDRFEGADKRHIYRGDYRYDASQSYAVVLTNTNKGYGWSANAGFKMKPIKDIDIEFAYTHCVNKEITGMPGTDAGSSYTGLPTVDGPNTAALHNSPHTIPDRLFLAFRYTDPGRNTWSLFWEAKRGALHYSYMTDGDLNGDKYNNDLLYIPASADELDFTSADDRDRFWEFVNHDPYLSSHKGGYASAYDVCSPWNHRLDFGFTHDFVIKSGQRKNIIQLSCIINNVLNLFNNSWCVQKQLNPTLNGGKILTVTNASDISSGASSKPIYSTVSGIDGNTAIWTPIYEVGQCWSAQIGLRYIFD